MAPEIPGLYATITGRSRGTAAGDRRPIDAALAAEVIARMQGVDGFTAAGDLSLFLASSMLLGSILGDTWGTDECETILTELGRASTRKAVIAMASAAMGG